LRDYWRLGKTTAITFELEIVDSDGTAHRGGITPPAWAEVAQDLEYVLVTVQEKQDPALHQASRKQVQFTAKASIPGSTLSANSGSTRQTAASKGEGSGGGVLRSSREKHRSSGMTSRPHEGGRRQKTRNNAQGESLAPNGEQTLIYFKFNLSKALSLVNNASAMEFYASSRGGGHSSALTARRTACRARINRWI
jgi:hypothetical protein